MADRWQLFAFDWTRYRSLAPLLQSAAATGDFSAIGGRAAEAAAAALAEGAPIEEVCNDLLVELCGAEDAVVFESGLPELIHAIRRTPEGEEAAELLGLLAAASPGIDPWFAAEAGLMGLLSPDQVEALSAALARFRRHWNPPPPPRGLGALTRRFAPGDRALDLLPDLMDLVDQCRARRAGLAASLEP